MESQFSLRFAELLTSRLCHDLIAPIGAINTGLELFQETSHDHLTESQEILNLILQSAQTASARVRFFRVAFGSNSQKVSLGETRQLIEHYFIRSKLEFHWQNPFQKDLLLEGWGRLLLNSVLWISECVPRKGTLYITSPTEESPGFSLHMKAESIILHQGTLEALEGRAAPEDLTPRTVACYLIQNIAKEKKATLNFRNTSSELFLEIKGKGM